MPRAEGKDLCEIFGYAPDDTSDAARKQWKSQRCPFVGSGCIKHSHPQTGSPIIYGSCSVLNKIRGDAEEVIICAHRLYANRYQSIKTVIHDATGADIPVYLANEYSTNKAENKLPDDYIVMIGKGSPKEIRLNRPHLVQLSLDWVMARITKGALDLIIPCEVQSADITSNYQDNWTAYSTEANSIPDSKHGMNWANIWKRLIPQLILKGAISSASTLSKKGHYFIVPDRVYIQFEKLLGPIPHIDRPGPGILTVMTYGLGPQVAFGSIRSLEHIRTLRMRTTDFVEAFGSGEQLLPLGATLDRKVLKILDSL